jgi:hypothetical protein
MNRQERAKKIDGLCDERGCDEKQRERHFDQYVKHGWNPHPSAAFMAWWNPTGNDPESGAHVGGHPEAARLWARKDPEGWVRSGYGITSTEAWNIAIYRQEFREWQAAGSPDKPEEFVSISATLERQKQYWHDAKPLMSLMLSGSKPEVIQPLVDELNKKYPGYDPSEREPF